MQEQINLENLALTIKQGFDRVDKQFEEIAIMVKQGFDEAENGR